MKRIVEYVNASQFVSRMKNKYFVNPIWVWDLLEDEFNIIKGLGCVISKEERDTIEQIIKEELKK